MLVLLPLFAWLLLLMLARMANLCRGTETDGRVEFLTASLAWGLLLTVITEALSSLRLLTAAGVTLSWLFICMLLLGLTLVAVRRLGSLRFGTPVHSLPLALKLSLLGIGLIVALTGLTAIVAPPNNWDSLTYHMSRIMHWIQNRTVDFYATHIVRQLFNAPWAEYSILHLQILSGSDRLANLVQWFSMVGSLIGVTLIAQELGADRVGQVYAAVVCGTIPMGILQASTTQNDYVVTFWLVCLAYFVLRLQRTGSARDALGTAGALGLALLTKATAYVYGPPLVLWYIVVGLKARRAPAARWLGLIAVVAVALNANHWRRNIALFGWPLGPTTLGENRQFDYVNARFGARITALNVAKNISLHLATPFPRVNATFARYVIGIASALGLDVNDPDLNHEPGRHPFSVRATSTNENAVGNPLHLALTLGSSLVCVTDRQSWSRRHRHRLAFLGVLALGFVAFSYYLRWQPWGTRLHLPLFVLASPIAGWMLGGPARWRMKAGIVGVPLLMAVPWVFASQQRPLIAWPGLTPFPSILASSRSRQYFNAGPDIEAPYRSAVTLIVESGCKNIGLSFGFDDAGEYLVWVLMQEASVSARIEHVDFDWDWANPSKVLATSFTPCAVFHVWYDDVQARKYAKALGGEIHQFDAVYAIVPAQP